MLASWKGTSNKARQYIKKQKHHFTNQSPYSQSNGVSSSTDVSESWTIKKAECQKNWCFIYFFLILIFTLFYFTILHWFCHTLTWISHGCTWVPNPEPPSPLPPHIISLDHPRAPAPNILYPESNIDCRFLSYMIVYMFKCHSPKSSHPLPLPQSPKVHPTHLCLFCCLVYRVIINIFLNSIYMC